MSTGRVYALLFGRCSPEVSVSGLPFTSQGVGDTGSTTSHGFGRGRYTSKESNLPCTRIDSLNLLTPLHRPPHKGSVAGFTLRPRERCAPKVTSSNLVTRLGGNRSAERRPRDNTYVVSTLKQIESELLLEQQALSDRRNCPQRLKQETFGPIFVPSILQVAVRMYSRAQHTLVVPEPRRHVRTTADVLIPRKCVEYTIQAALHESSVARGAYGMMM